MISPVCHASTLLLILITQAIVRRGANAQVITDGSNTGQVSSTVTGRIVGVVLIVIFAVLASWVILSVLMLRRRRRGVPMLPSVLGNRTPRYTLSYQQSRRPSHSYYDDSHFENAEHEGGRRTPVAAPPYGDPNYIKLPSPPPPAYQSNDTPSAPVIR